MQDNVEERKKELHIRGRQAEIKRSNRMEHVVS
jgi:hypothetical protein